MSRPSLSNVLDWAQSGMAILGAGMVVKWAAQLAYAAGYSAGFN